MSGDFRCVTRKLKEQISSVPWRVLMLSSPRAAYEGLEIIDLRSETRDFGSYCEGVRAALDLISTRQPWRLPRILRNVRRILIVETAGAEFWPALKACVLYPQLISRGEVETALAIAHEATHARLMAIGFGYNRNMRTRIEGICVRQEIALAEQLPESVELIDKLRNQLATPWWSDSDLFQRKVEILRRSNAPEWLINVLEMLFSPK